MVDEKRIEKKLTGILVDTPATSHQGSIDYKKKERAVHKFKRKNPMRYRSLLFNIFKAFQAFDAEVTAQTLHEIDEFNKSFEKPRAN